MLLDLFLHFLALSLLAIGGAITTAPEMHRYLVADRGWLSEDTFTQSIALAQAAPGPNILFVAVLGYQVAGLAGAFAAMSGIMLPSTTLVLIATRWARAHQEDRLVRAFTLGLQPLTLGLIIATGWLLAAPYLQQADWRLPVAGLVAVTLGLSMKTRLSVVWMVLLGGIVGALTLR